MIVQDTILKGIQDLLYRENFLILPGFGGFVLKPQSAGFNSTGTQLLPASKRPGFNRQLKQNDGVLQNWLQQELVCDASAALKHLEEFAGYCNTLLSTRRRLNMKGLGFFYLDFESNLCFEAQSDVNFQAESFGLSPVSLVPIKEPLRDEKGHKKIFTDRIAPVPATRERTSQLARPNFKKVFLTSMAILIVVIGLGSLISLKGVSGRLYSTLFITGNEAVYTPILYTELPLKSPVEPKEIRLENEKAVSILELDPGLHLKVICNTTSPLSGRLKSVETEQIIGSYYTVVLGSFSVPHNAINFEKQLKSKFPEGEVISHPQHKHRMVSMGRYRDKELAREAMRRLETEYPGAWILKR